MPAEAARLTTVERVIQPSHIRAAHISAAKQPKPRDRVVSGPFARLVAASDPGNLPAEGRRHHAKVTVFHGTVKDPYGSKRPQKVAFNAHRDALLYDLRQKRINHDSYAAGVTYRALLERSHGMASGQQGEWLQPLGGNKVHGQLVRMCALIEQGDSCQAQFAITQPVIGMTGARILELVLLGTGDGDGPKTMSETAQIIGLVDREAGEDDRAYATRSRLAGQQVGTMFRLALKNLASLWQYGDAPKLEEPAWKRRR